MAHIVQHDAAVETNNAVNFFNYSYLEYFIQNGEGERKFVDIVAGSTLVLLIGTDKDDNHYTVTDNFGNNWVQVPGVRSAGNGRTADIWYAENVAAVIGPDLLYITVVYDGTPAHIGVAIYQLAGSTTLIASGHNEGAQLVSLAGDSGTDVFLAIADNFIQSGWTEDEFLSYGGVTYSLSGTGTQNARGVNVLSAVVFSGGNDDGGTALTNLSGKSAGDVLTDNQITALIPATTDRGHVLDGVVRAGTLQGWNGRTGVIMAGDGDTALPTAHTGEFAAVRAHVDDFTYSPVANGDRVKFVMNRNSAGDKLALLVTPLAA